MAHRVGVRRASARGNDDDDDDVLPRGFLGLACVQWQVVIGVLCVIVVFVFASLALRLVRSTQTVPS